MNELRIVFMGTPEFAVPSLEILLERGYNVVAVVTAPDKPQGRGQKIEVSPVKAAAVKHNLNILQPTNLKATEFVEALRSLNANLQIVVAFRMLPEIVWSMPKLGTFNLHGSLLPQYRGAAPIHWAVINGEKETGVTTFFLKHEIDTGSVIYQDREQITYDDTVGSVYERLMIKGAALVLKTVQAIEQGNAPAQPQHDGGTLKHAPKIFRETCEIKWDQPADDIRNFIRGLNPFPIAWTTLQGKIFKIQRASVEGGGTGSPGTIETDEKTYLKVRAADGWVAIEELQPEGKRKMSVSDFFRGNKL
ncbi:methionyl-tRNA formyltransferase [Chryseolinea sp. T2]|uniref:methionyl-tRNA formyltransferase n=1 Tax=Chryseolinea sp. T2 TaxID=3129255 RepID=UPI0030779C45